MPVRTDQLGLTLLFLLLCGCSQCESWLSSCGLGSVVSEPAGDCPGCSPPRWYWSRGRYISHVDDHLTRQAAVRCAQQSLDRRNAKPCSNDFCCGYQQAFIDLAFGSGGVIPAVPPERYWKAHNRSPKGYQRVDEWYAGYREGVCDAQAQGHLQYLYIPTSGEALMPPSPQGNPYWGPAPAGGGMVWQQEPPACPVN